MEQWSIAAFSEHMERSKQPYVLVGQVLVPQAQRTSTIGFFGSFRGLLVVQSLVTEGRNFVSTLLATCGAPYIFIPYKLGFASRSSSAKLRV